MLGEFIRKQRTKKEITQKELATELRISRPTYTQIESGKRELTISEAKRLAAVFDIPLQDFLNEEETKRRVTIEKASRKKQKALHIRVLAKDLDKFKQVILYVLIKVGAKPNVGETVLHKLLYFIDFDYYEKFEENLMGATYIKNHHGPTSVDLGAILREMQEQEEIKVVKTKYHNYTQKKYLPQKNSDLSAFSARDKEHIDAVLARLSDKSDKEIENHAHGDIPWLSAEYGQALAYESVFYRDEKYSARSYRDAV